MKKLRSLGVLVLPIFVLFLFTGCPPIDSGGSGSFTYDGTTYQLTSGALEDFGQGEILSRHFDIVLASSGLDAERWRGRGDVVWFCLESSSTIGASGQYDWAGTDGLLLYDGGISFDFNATMDTGMWIYADWEGAASEDYLTISENDGTYTIDFSVTLDDGKVVTGNFTGPLPFV